MALPLLADDSAVRAARDLFAAKRDAESRTAFEKIATAEPRNAEARFYLGVLAERRDDTEEAVKQLEQAVALAPDNSYYTLELGGAYGHAAEKAGLFSKFGLAKKCLVCLQKAVELDPNNLEARNGLVSYYRAAPSFIGGGIDKAYAQAEEIRKRNVPMGAAVLGQLYLDEKKPEEAFKLFEDTLKTAPDSYSVLYAIGRTAAQTGLHLDRGEEALHRCLVLTAGRGDPPHAAAQWRLGTIAERRGNVSAARTAYEAALKLDPAFKPAVQSLAKLK